MARGLWAASKAALETALAMWRLAIQGENLRDAFTNEAERPFAWPPDSCCSCGCDLVFDGNTREPRGSFWVCGNPNHRVAEWAAYLDD